MVSFESFNFDQELLTAIENAKFTRASKLQKTVIPEILLGKDLIASAHSGSGKSASFILPLIQILLRVKANEPETEDALNKAVGDLAEALEEELDITPPVENLEHPETELNTKAAKQDESSESGRPKNGPKVLILAPTRELANQISACIRRFTKELDLRYGILVGGAPYPPQVRMLKKPIDFLVATPGRLLDHLKNDRVNFDKIEYLVIDEVNRMLDMKMNDDLHAIIEQIPKTHTLQDRSEKPRQTLLFSGNLEGEALEKFSAEIQQSPIRFELARSKQHYRALQQSMYIADDLDHKLKLCKALISGSDSKHIMLASQSQTTLDTLFNFLNDAIDSHEKVGAPEDAHIENKELSIEDDKHLFFIHDEQPLQEDHRLRLSPDVKVIHLDLPDDILVFLQRLESSIDQKSEQEIHLLVGGDEWSILNQIERYIGKTLSRKKVEGLEPQSSEPSVGTQTGGTKNTNQTKNRNPYSGRRQNAKQNNKGQGKQTRNQGKENKSGGSRKNNGSKGNGRKGNAGNGNSVNSNVGNGNAGNYGDQDGFHQDFQPQLTSYELGNNAFGNQNSNKPNSNKPNQKRKNNGQNKNTAGPRKDGQNKQQNAKNNKTRNKRKNSQTSNTQTGQDAGNSFNSDTHLDERDLSWKQYISNISNGNSASKSANKKFRKNQGKQNGNFDLNHSPMAVSARKNRDIAKNEEWAAEVKEANKPSVQIRVKNTIKSKSNPDNASESSTDAKTRASTNGDSKPLTDAEGNRIGGKLGINK